MLIKHRLGHFYELNIAILGNEPKTPVDVVLCAICKTEPRVWYKNRFRAYCSTCSAKQNKQNRHIRDVKRVSLGLCVKCGQLNSDPTKYCRKCVTKIHPPRYLVGMVLNGREILDTRTQVTYPKNGHNKGQGRIASERHRREYLLWCPTCQTETWVKLWMHLEKVPVCTKCIGTSKRTKFCSTCGKYTPSKKGLNGQCKNCYIPPKWKIEDWVQQGRSYSSLDLGGRLKKTRKDMIRQFLHVEQNGLCKLCKQPLDINGSLIEKAHLDHDHVTDRTRGLVHPVCNYLIGAIEARGFPAPVHALVQGLFEYFKPEPPAILGPSEPITNV